VTDLSEAEALVRKLEGDLAANAAAIECLLEGKRSAALLATKGDRQSQKLLAQSNAEIKDLQLHAADLEAALAGARAELAEAEAAERQARDRERADRLEELGAQFAKASVVVDDAMEALRVALEARDELGRRLVSEMPGEPGRDLSFRVLNPGPIVRAARAAGLAKALGLRFYEAHHCCALAELALPEITEAVAELRGDPDTDREAA